MEIFNDPKGYKKWYELHNLIYTSEKNLVNTFKPYNCLDIGSGPSIFHEVFKGYTVSLDISIFMLKEVSESEDKVLAEAHFLPFRDNSFPCIFISVTICFLDKLEEFVKEVKRVTKDRIIICFIPRDSVWGRYYEELGRKGHKYYSHANFIGKKELYDLLRNENLKINKVMSTLFISPWDKEKIDDIKENDEGSFVCIEARKFSTP